MIRKIPEDTYYFHFYNANPKGRRESDCCISVIKDDRFWDTWDPSDYTVGNFWIKEECKLNEKIR